MNAPAQPNVCPQCSCRLEKDGVCLVCLLNEGLVAEDEKLEAAEKSSRTLSLPCDFAGYRLLREIASGGMGIVYEAEDVKLKRVVALKVVRNAHFATREEAARFRAEAQAVGMLDHPNIIPIYESGEEDGMPYYTMRLAEGGSLAERLKQHGAMSDREAASLISTIARAVQHAHDHGVLHRDLKPANILMDVSGSPMLSDFGLAKILDGGLQMTQSLSLMGTPHYMSPEQAAGNGKHITTASDVWALGVMLYQMLADKLPFQGGNAVDVVRRITLEEPEISTSGKLKTRSGTKANDMKPSSVSAISLQRVQRDLATLILRCLEKQPARRLASAGFLADELDRFLSGEPIQSRAVGSLERLWKFTWRNKAATFAILGISVSLIAGTGVSVWQMVKAQEAEKAALQQKAESDQIADIVIKAVRNTDASMVGKVVDLDQLRDELLEKMKAFPGDPERKAAMLLELSAMLTKPSDIQLFRQVLAELEPRVQANDPLLWSLRYRVALKNMHASDAATAESRAARDELHRILAWQVSHLSARDTQPYNTKFALAAELMDEVGTPEALKEAEDLLRSCLAFYQRRHDTFDIITCNTRLMSAVFNQGRHEEALKLGRETCELATKKMGEGQAITGRAYGRLAEHCRDAGLIEESITHSRHALDIFWRTVGPGNLKANATLDNLAEMLEKKGEHEGVLHLRRAALSACDQQMGAMSPYTQWQVAKVVDALRDQRCFDEAHGLAELWLNRVRVDGQLPPGAAALLVGDFLTLQDLDRHGQAEVLLLQLPEMIKAQQWSKSANYLLRCWQAVAASLNTAGRPSDCIMIAKHVIHAFENGEISGRDSISLRPEFQKLLEEAPVDLN